MDDKDKQVEVVKEAIREWLDDQFAAFGKWTLRGILAALFVWLIQVYLVAHGWTK